MNERLRIYPLIALFVVALVLPVWWALGALITGGPYDLSGRALGGDFPAFYGAASLAWDNPTAIWNRWELGARLVEHIGEGKYNLPIFYAPPLAIWVAPLAALDYASAYFVWALFGLAAWLIALKISNVPDGRRRLLVASPATLWCFMHGQTGFAVASLAVLGLLIARRRPGEGGFILGLLLFKFQYLVPISVVLFANAEWRTLRGVAASVGLQVLLTGLLLGWDVWPAFLAQLPQTSAFIENSLPGGDQVSISVMMSMAGSLAWLGMPMSGAMLLHALTAALALAVASGTRKRGVSDRSDAMIMLAALLFTPFSYGYDWVLSLVPIGLAMRSADRPREYAVLAVAWATPFLHIAAMWTLGVPVAPFVLLFTMALLMKTPVLAPANEMRV